MCNIKLVLNAGDTVRNIRERSSFKGWVGKVSLIDKKNYRVTYQNGHVADYLRHRAHESLEKLVNEDRQFMKCASFGLRYGMDPLAEAEKLWAELLACTPGSRIEVVHDEIRFVEPKRHTLKRVRRNVLTGKTQEDHVKASGYACGVQEFNTRALGRSTGQALHAIGSAMMNPGTEIRIAGIDHYLYNQNHAVGSRRAQVDTHFRQLVQSLIGNMKGFTFTDTHIVFNPIVTEETYVEL